MEKGKTSELSSGTPSPGHPNVHPNADSHPNTDSHPTSHGHPTSHPNMVSLVNYWKKEEDKHLNDKIAQTLVPLNSARVREEESNLGNYIADAVRRKLPSIDVVLMNGGGIRNENILPAGDITAGFVLNTHPFGNQIVPVTTTGRVLKKVLNASLSCYDTKCGDFKQVSGIRYSFYQDADTWKAWLGDVELVTRKNKGGTNSQGGTHGHTSYTPIKDDQRLTVGVTSFTYYKVIIICITRLYHTVTDYMYHTVTDYMVHTVTNTYHYYKYVSLSQWYTRTRVLLLNLDDISPRYTTTTHHTHIYINNQQ